MYKFESITRPVMWATALLLTTLATGCGGGGGGAPILGGGGSAALTPSTLIDVIKPRVTITIPATTIPGPTLVAPANVPVTATFTEAMALASINATSFTVICDPLSLVPCVNPVGTVSYVAATKTALFTHAAPLTFGASYIATVHGIGGSVATDLAGNPLAGNQAALPAASDYIWTFIASAVDIIPPTITLESPADLATGVAINTAVHATFSEPMDPASISFPLQGFGPPLTAALAGAVSYDPLTNIATFTPSVNLAASTKYQATVTAASDLAGNLLIVPAVGVPANPWTFTTGTGLAAGAINLGTASTFGIMATAAITSTGNSVVNGDVSLNPGTSMTGFPPAVVNGAIHINDTVSAQARTDLLTAYNAAKALPPGAGPNALGAGADLGALFPAGVPPGTYTSGSTIILNTPTVLDAGGNVNAVWVFQIGSSLTTNANVSLINGAQAKNVFWVPTADATIGVGTIFSGTLVTGRSVTGVTGSTINGRILAGAITAGTVALQATTVNVPLP